MNYSIDWDGPGERERMARTYFRDFTRDDGSPITVEYGMEGETCAYIVDAWPRTDEYNRLWSQKNQIEAGAYGNKRHFISFNEDEREALDDIDRAIEAAKIELSDAERERMEAELSEKHIHESDEPDF
jgi:hypothetical protein